MSFSFEAKNELCRLPVQKLCPGGRPTASLLPVTPSAQARCGSSPGTPLWLPGFPSCFTGPSACGSTGCRRRGRAQAGVPDHRRRQSSAGSWTCWASARRQNLALHINFGLLEEECCRASFLRGCSLSAGQRQDAAKRYHLELATSHLQVSRELEVLLRECGYPPKSVARNGSFITYFKQSDQIEDFLTLIGAPVAAMSVMSAKLEKDLRNSVNRRLNCDSANLDKAVEAAQEQLESIRSSKAAGLLDQLPDKLQLTAALRLENPELTLSELAEEFDPPVTKSCLNHRLRKITQLAKGL